MEDDYGKVLVGYVGDGIIQRHILVPKSQWEDGHMVARYLLNIQLQVTRFGVKPCDVEWAVVSERELIMLNPSTFKVRRSGLFK